MNEQYLLPLFIFGTVIITSFAMIIIVFVIIQRQRQVRSRLEKQQLEFNYNNSLLKTKIEVQEQALLNVSQEIHDSIGQELSFSCLQLAALKGKIKDVEAEALLVENLDLIRQSVKNLRLLSHSLNTSLIEQRDLEEAIDQELNRLKVFSPMKCFLEINGTQAELKSETKLLLFRVVQEALQNVVKHAEARMLKIILSYTPDSLEMSIIDDGKGIAAEKLGGATMGMENMRQRTAMLKGVFSVHSGEGSGTSIVLNVPI